VVATTSMIHIIARKCEMTGQHLEQKRAELAERYKNRNNLGAIDQPRYNYDVEIDNLGNVKRGRSRCPGQFPTLFGSVFL